MELCSIDGPNIRDDAKTPIEGRHGKQSQEANLYQKSDILSQLTFGILPLPSGTGCAHNANSSTNWTRSCVSQSGDTANDHGTPTGRFLLVNTNIRHCVKGDVPCRSSDGPASGPSFVPRFFMVLPRRWRNVFESAVFMSACLNIHGCLRALRQAPTVRQTPEFPP